MPAPRKTQAHVRDSLRPRGLSRNVGLHGIPGLDKAVGWNDPAFLFICQVAIEMRSAGVELTRETLDAVIKMGRSRHANGLAPDGGPKPPPPPRTPSREEMAAIGVVYYIRRDEFVKIGTTIRLRDRMRALAPDEILAVEPGSYQLERLLHRRFAHLRAPFMREYFRRAPELDTHIAEVLERHGPPPEGLLVFG